MIAFTIACLLPAALLLTVVPIVLLGVTRKGARVSPRSHGGASPTWRNPSRTGAGARLHGSVRSIA